MAAEVQPSASGTAGKFSHGISSFRRDLLLACGTLLGLLQLVYTVAPMMDGTARPSYFLAASAAFVAWSLVVAARFFRSIRKRTYAAPVDGDLPELPAIGLALFTTLTSLYGMLPNRQALPAMAVVAVIASVMLLRRWRRGALLTCLIAGLSLLVMKTVTVRIDVRAADMLPTILWASHEVLAGHNPYYSDQSAIAPALFYYLPFLWLPFLPSAAIGGDPRWVSVAVAAGLSLLLLRYSWRRAEGIALLGLGVSLLVCRQGIIMAYQGEVWPMWAYVVGFSAAFAWGPRWLAAVLLGVLLVTHQTFILLLPFVGLHWWHTTGFVRAAMLGAIVLGAAAVPVTLVSQTPYDFLLTYFYRVPKLVEELRGASWNSVQMSLLAILTNLGLRSIRLPLQVATGLAGVLGLVVWRPARPDVVLALAGLTMTVAVSLNVQVFPYYYMPGIVLLAMGVFAWAPSGAESDPAGTRRSTR